MYCTQNTAWHLWRQQCSVLCTVYCKNEQTRKIWWVGCVSRAKIYGTQTKYWMVSIFSPSSLPFKLQVRYKDRKVPLQRVALSINAFKALCFVIVRTYLTQHDPCSVHTVYLCALRDSYRGHSGWCTAQCSPNGFSNGNTLCSLWGTRLTHWIFIYDAVFHRPPWQWRQKSLPKRR
jgi:hypothetical protein